MHNKFSCGHTVLENNLRENSSLSYLFTKPTKQVFKFVRTKTETCALKLETIRGPRALSVYMSNLWALQSEAKAPNAKRAKYKIYNQINTCNSYSSIIINSM
jgi:hypothetical protein